MFHGEVFSSSIASGANTFAQLTYISADAVLPAIVNGMQVSTQLPNLMAVAGVGAHLVHVRPQANSMLPMPYPALSPNNRGSALESPPRFWDFSGNPIPLKPTEEFDIFATQNLGTAETEYVFCLFTDGIATPVPVGINPPGTAGMGAIPGRAFSVHWTATQTLTAGAFTSLQPAFDQTLPAGQYALIGARVFSATGLFFRMLPAMGPLWRPGGACMQAYDQLDPYNQRMKNGWSHAMMGWGVWMTFYQNVPPKVEIFATAADTAEEGWFDLVYLSGTTSGGL